MSLHAASQANTTQSSRAVYTHGYSDAHREMLGIRTAANDAAFFLPHLRPDMRLLDCGCGQGALTLDFARILTQGAVVGVDLESSQTDAAQALARDAGIVNAHFRVADLYDLPFPAASFDAVFANTVLEHNARPLNALKEMRRVLKPGGVIGVQDPDYRTFLFAPSTPLLRRAFALYLRVHKKNGGSPHYALLQRQLLRQAGCVRTEGYALAYAFGTPEATRWYATMVWQEFLRAPGFRGTAAEHGWATHAELDAMVDEFGRWGEHADAYGAAMFCAAIGWVGHE